MAKKTKRNTNKTATLRNQVVTCYQCGEVIRGRAVTPDALRQEHVFNDCPAVLEDVETPREELGKVDGFPCSHGECDFIAKTASGLQSHMRKHERDDLAAAEAAEQEKLNDPIYKFDHLLEQIEKNLNIFVTRTGAEQKENKDYFDMVQVRERSLSNLKNNLIPRLKNLAPTPDVVRKIEQFEAAAQSLELCLVEAMSDERYSEGRFAFDTLEHVQTVRDAQDEASEFNQEVGNSIRKLVQRWQDEESMRWRNLMSGNLRVPTSGKRFQDRGELHLLEDAYIKMIWMLTKENPDACIPYREITLDVVETAIPVVFDYVTERYCFRKNYTRKGKIRVATVNTETGKISYHTENVTETAELPFESWFEEFRTEILAIHKAIFRRGTKIDGEWRPLEAADYLYQQGKFGSGNQVMSLAYVYWPGKNKVKKNDTAIEAAFKKAQQAKAAEAALQDLANDDDPDAEELD